MNPIKVGAFAWYSFKIRVIFGVRFERRKIDKESKPKGKRKHAQFIVEYFEYFMPNVIKIDPYNFELYRSKLVHFF